MYTHLEGFFLTLTGNSKTTFTTLFSLFGLRSSREQLSLREIVKLNVGILKGLVVGTTHSCVCALYDTSQRFIAHGRSVIFAFVTACMV